MDDAQSVGVSGPAGRWALSRLIAPVIVALAALLAVAILRSDNTGVFSATRMLAITGASSLLIWLPGMALVCASSRRLDDIEACLRLALGCGASGAILFPLWLWSPMIGAVAGVLIVLASVRTVAGRPEALTPMLTPLLLMCGFALLCVAVGADHGGMESALHTIAVRYWASVDSALPMLLADNLMLGRDHLLPFVDAGTHTSDRPPLQAGMMLIAYPMAQPGVKLAVALALGIAANALWIPGFWAFLRALRLPARMVGFVTIVVMLTGSVFFNTLYTWPKMLSAAYCFCAASLFLSGAMSRRGRPLLAGAAAGLAVLAHSGIAFGLIGLAPFLWLFRERWDWRGLTFAVATAAIVYSPWIAYQRFIDPPGDRMPKWHLAGVIEPSPISFRTALMQQYRAAGVSGTLENKARNVAVFVGVKTWDPVPEWGWTDTLLGQIRVATLRAFALSALLSPLFLLLYWWSPHRRAIGAVGAVIGASSIVFLLLEFGDASYQSAAWLHHGPYSLLILWAAIGAMAAAHSPLWARVLVAFQLVSFVVLWIIDAAHPQWRDTTLGPISPLMTIVQVALLAAMAYLAFRWTGRQAATSSEAPGQVALTG